MPDRIDWRQTTLVHVPRPRCPRCGTLTPPIIQKTTPQGDGSIYRLLVCRRCSTPWRLVLDPDEPVSSQWNPDDDDLDN